MPKIKTRPCRVTHNINPHRMQVHESVLCSVWRTVISPGRRAAKIDVTIDIRLVLLQCPRHELRLMKGCSGVRRNVDIRQS
jgi:hypothetical protein